MEKKNWAIVDDDTIFHLTTRIMIENHNVDKEIKVFRNGKEAIEYIKNNLHSEEKLPDVILLDLYMPVMDGWDFLEAYLPIRETVRKKIVVYIVSSSIDQNDMRRAQEISAIKKYFIKPIERHELKQIIQDLKAA